MRCQVLVRVTEEQHVALLGGGQTVERALVTETVLQQVLVDTPGAAVDQVESGRPQAVTCNSRGSERNQALFSA